MSDTWRASLSIVQLLVQAWGREWLPRWLYPDGYTWLSCLHGCLLFLHRQFPPQTPPSHPLGPLPPVNNRPHPGIAPQSSSQLPAAVFFLGDLCMAAARIVCVILIPFGLSQISCFTLSLKCFSSSNCPDVGIRPLLQFPHLLRAVPLLLTLFFSPYFLHPTKFWVFLHILFQLSGTPACSKLVFCKHCSVWRCSPDVSMERDVLHVYLRLCHFVLIIEYWA